ncbi:cytochrome c oxidase assembly protein COX16 homolog, mitochondrial isoform X2 [Lynx canadensis]|uniref:cytochrome c oxidase assembly protein COX16 homolog, mitochondrial isoform X2 n=1 Tax=Lynx canadensis TaxID=61383 RepID=UPI0011B06FE5|nr:cytochrome c oxidase assembly protein COX16 homolog, mitochondrial isoform X2 [Lynx canadensis]
MSTQAVMRALRKNKTLRYGVPMLVLIVGGSFGLREFSQIRYDAVKIKIDPELEKKLKMNKVSLESEYEVNGNDYQCRRKLFTLNSMVSGQLTM